MFRATKVASYASALSQMGIPQQALLAGTHIDTDNLASNEYLITVNQYQRLIQNMISLSGDPGIAFTMAEKFSLNDLGIVGYAMASAGTVAEMSDVWSRYSNTLVGAQIRTRATALANGYQVVLSDSTYSASVLRFEVEEIFARGYSLLQQLTGVAPRYGELQFSYPEPEYSDRYRQFFRCPMVFDAPQTRVTILQPQLDTPILGVNDELFSLCNDYCRQVMTSLKVANPLYEQLRELFLLSPGKLPDLNEAGRALGLSSRTISRQLEAHGRSYQGVKDEFRFDLAREYLVTGYMSPKQVAYLLGFSSPSTFSRAFKTWSGQTIGQYLSR